MSARIRFLCVACKAVMDAPVDRAGNKIHCLKCGQRLQIPSAERALTILAPSLGVDGDADAAPTATTPTSPTGKVATATVAPKSLELASENVPPAGRRFYYIKNGQRFGPILLKHMQELVASDKLRPDDTVWVEGTPQWVPAQEVSELYPKSPVAVVSVAPPVAKLPVVPRTEEDLPATSKPWQEEEVTAPRGISSSRSTPDDEVIRCPYCNSTQFFCGRRVTMTGWVLYACAIVNLVIVSPLLMFVCIGFVTIFLSPILALIGMVYCRALVNTCGRCRRDF